jgi:hypothetical protein
MKRLPIYIELEKKDKNGKPIVISHASIGSIWHMKDIDSLYYRFRQQVNTNRRNPGPDSKIFNIFGHTPVNYGVDINENYVNVDTGCFINLEEYNRLSCYCIETEETLNQKKIDK